MTDVSVSSQVGNRKSTVEGIEHTESRRKLLLGLAGVGIISVGVGSAVGLRSSRTTDEQTSNQDSLFGGALELNSAPSFSNPSATVTDALGIAVTRLTYGYTPGMRTSLTEMGVETFVEDQLAKNSPDPEIESQLAELTGFGQDKFVYNGARKTPHLQNLVHSSVYRATNSDHQLYEVVCNFWYDHFSVDSRGGAPQANLARHFQETVIRPNAMGKFRDLLQAVIHSPAMLEYLDNAASNANAPEGVNENLGREILELHTLGIDENDEQIYDLEDVQQASLALAGVSYTGKKRTQGYYQSVFKADFAYDGEVTLLDGQWSSAGLANKDVANSMIDFLANHPQTARYISYKLCRRFVADNPPTSLVESAAQVFRENDTAIVPTLRHIFSSDEFAESASQKYRRPFEFVVAALRAVDASIPVVNTKNDTLAEGEKPSPTEVQTIATTLDSLTHSPWQWEMPDGYPDRASEWVNAAGMQLRWNFVGEMATSSSVFTADATRYRPEQAATVDDLITTMSTQWGMGQLPQADREAIATAGEVALTDNADALETNNFEMITGLLLAHPLFQTR